MISEARLNANRRNSQRSTGPKTEQGKARSRLNACRHGLTGAGVVLPDEEAQKVAEREQQWASPGTPRSGELGWMYHQMIVATVRIERCQREASQRVGELAQRALACWAEDRDAEIEELARHLPQRPSLTVARLRCRRAGVDWLLERWWALLFALDERGSWSEEEWSLAFDLLGVDPMLRNSAHALPREDPAALREQVEAVIGELEELKDCALNRLDELERQMAERGQGLTNDPVLKRLTRYEAASWRVYQKTFAVLSKYRNPAEPVAGPSSTREVPGAMTPAPARPLVSSPAMREPRPDPVDEPAPALPLDSTDPELGAAEPRDSGNKTKPPAKMAVDEAKPAERLAPNPNRVSIRPLFPSQGGPAPRTASPSVAVRGLEEQDPTGSSRRARSSGAVSTA
jgi:hypothetical protein